MATHMMDIEARVSTSLVYCRDFEHDAARRYLARRLVRDGW